eukprot:48414-Eustigmatos_ZCMA.PRE.1
MAGRTFSRSGTSVRVACATEREQIGTFDCVPIRDVVWFVAACALLQMHTTSCVRQGSQQREG